MALLDSARADFAAVIAQTGGVAVARYTQGVWATTILAPGLPGLKVTDDGDILVHGDGVSPLTDLMPTNSGTVDIELPILTVADAQFGLSPDVAVDATAALNAANQAFDTNADRSFQINYPDRRYKLSGAGAGASVALVTVQNAMKIEGASLEGTLFDVAAGATADCVFGDDGNAAKLEHNNAFVYCNNNPNLKAVFSYGVAGVQFGTYGRLDNLMARDAPNAAGFDLDVNIGAVGELYTLNTKIGLKTQPTTVGMLGRTFTPYEFRTVGLVTNLGDTFKDFEAEAGGDESVPWHAERGGVLGIGSVIISPAAGRSHKAAATYNPIYSFGNALGALTVIQKGATPAFFNYDDPKVTSTTTAVGVNTITDSTQNWRRNEFKGGYVIVNVGLTAVVNGANVSIERAYRVVDNTADTIRIAGSSFANDPPVGSTYKVDQPCQGGTWDADWEIFTRYSGKPGHAVGRDLTLTDAHINDLTTYNLEANAVIIGSRGSVILQDIAFKYTGVDFGAIAAGASATLTFAAPGAVLLYNWGVTITRQEQSHGGEGLILEGIVSANNVLSITAHNFTAAAVDATAQVLVAEVRARFT